MLRIVRSPFGGIGHESLTERIRALTEKKKSSYLIVPEQQTVLSEAEMAELLPSFAPLFFEVTNFTRLANSTFRALGGISGEYCDAGKRALIMWRTLTELSPVLSMTAGRREVSTGLVERALGAVKEMQSFSIDAGELADASEREEITADKRLSAKLSDLSKIYTLYKRLLTEKYSDVGDDVAEMIKRLAERPEFLSDKEIFIEGFTSFTEPQYKLIGMLAARTSVTVLLTVSKHRREAFEYSEIRDTEERLRKGARASGADIKIEHETARRPYTSELLASLPELLWFKSANIDNLSLQSNEELRIFEASTPFEECDFVASDIKRRVMQGASFSEFAVIAADADKYSGILDTALSAADIPVFTSAKRDVSAFEVIKLIYTAYSAALRGFSREDVLTYAKCGLSGLSREECDELESYINTWQLSGSRFTDGAVWNMNPAGYTARRAAGTDEKLLRINSARERLIAPLSGFAEEIKAATTVREHAEALLSLLTRLNTEEQLSSRADALMLLGEGEFAEENRRLWGLICDSLDALVEVSGEQSCDADGFLSQLKILFSNADIGRIPSYRDSVTVGSASMIRLREKKHVYMLGVNAGEFPAAVTESSYFSERDKARLSALGLSFTPELEIKSARELYIFTRSLAYATESVTLLYTARDTRHKATEPSEVIERISALTGGSVQPVKISSLSPSERIYSARQALEETADSLGSLAPAVREALLSCGYDEALRISESPITNTRLSLGKELCRELYSSPLALTQSRIDSFVGCPLAYFCRFTVGLSEERRAELDAPGIGSFIHAILENFFRALSVEGKTAAELTEEEKRLMTRRAAEKYIAELGEPLTSSSAVTKIKLERLCRAAMPVVEGLCEEFSSSLFEPRFFELAIKRDDPSSPSPIVIKPNAGEDIYVYGIIDRVDTYKKGDDVYLRVVDYKTGHKDFSPEDMASGSNLQMFLYLKALLDTENERFKQAAGVGDGGRLIPAGVIYVKTAVGDVRVDTPSDEAAIDAVKAAQEREGMILDDPEIISAMNIKYTPVYSARYPDKIPDGKRKYLFSEESFGEIMKTVESSVMSVAAGIRGGDASAAPKADPRGIVHCDFCEYKPICRVASKLRG
ncbi:MAG: PD-(D/E)XK nuclease family protein [Clostridia bacterium]|nr:PD-(D/E)XK nuclease family protein [Clostridia bacterium]